MTTLNFLMNQIYRLKQAQDYITHPARYHKHAIVLGTVNRVTTIRERPKVIHIISDILIGGSEKIVFDLMNKLGDAYDMHLVILSEKEIFRQATRVFEEYKTIEDLVNHLNQDSHNIIHVHYYGDFFGMHQFLNKLLDKLPKSICIENVNNPIQAYAHKLIKKTIYVSHYVQKLQRRQQGTDTVIHPGIDLKIFQPRKIKHDQWCNVGLVYRLYNDKLSVHTIDQLIELLIKSKFKIKYHIVGIGPNYDYYRKAVKKERLQKYFKFYGEVKYADLADIYDKFDLFLAPVHTESYGLVVPYAMAKEIPVVAMNLGAIPEIVRQKAALGETFEEMEVLVEKFIKNHYTLPDYNLEKGREIVKKYLSEEQMIDQYNRVYKNCLRK
jgi:glycosyltransferase involved in cell wall biosynthesis